MATKRKKSVGESSSTSMSTDSEEAQTPKKNSKLAENIAVRERILNTELSVVKRNCKTRGGETPVHLPDGRVINLWDVIYIVKDPVTNKSLDKAQCLWCKKVFCFRDVSGGTGTSTLSRHLKDGYCGKARVGAPGSDAVRVPADSNSKESFTKAAAKFCAFKMISPQCLNDAGAEFLIEACIDIGVDQGRVKASTVTRHPQTIMTSVHKQAEEAKAEVAAEIDIYLRQNRMAVTSDLYTNDFTKIKFLGLTSHYITDNWELLSRFLFCLPMLEGATGVSILAALKEHMQAEYEISPPMLKKLTWVTDNGADMVKALQIENLNRVYCADHAINIIVRTTLSVKYHALVRTCLDGTPAAQHIVDSIKDWVKSVRSLLPEDHPELDKTQLKTSVPASESHVAMLSCYCSLHKKVQEILGEKTPVLPSDVHLKDIKILIDFLRPFDLGGGTRETKSDVSSGKYPTLEKHVACSTSDPPMVQSLKSLARIELRPMKAVVAIDKCKSFVTFMNQTSLNSRQYLPRTLKQEICTRWNSQLRMIESVLKVWEELGTLMAQDKYAKTGRPKFRALDKEILVKLKKFLKPFKIHSLKVESRNVPTIQYVALAHDHLLAHTYPRQTDCELLNALRAAAYPLISKIEVNENHLIATFLWPSMKKLVFLDSTEKEKVSVKNILVDTLENQVCKLYAEVRRRIQETERNQTVLPSHADEASTSATAAATTPALPSKKRKQKESIYSKYMDKPATTMDEVDRYIALPLCEIGDDSNILNWWKVQGSVRYPKLASIAKEVLAIPASSAPSETVFSDANNLCSPQRSTMAPQTLNHFLLLRDYLRKQNPGTPKIAQSGEESEQDSGSESDSDLSSSEPEEFVFD